jgi:predicted ester cyclase
MVSTDDGAQRSSANALVLQVGQEVHVSGDHKRLFATLMDEVFNRGNYDAADDLVAADFHNHEAPDSPGPEGFKATARWLRHVFPDYRAELHETLSDGDYIVARLMVSGTHVGDFMGMVGTGRTFSVQHMHMYRIENDKLAEHWACRDDLGQLIQLGISPPTSE